MSKKDDLMTFKGSSAKEETSILFIGNSYSFGVPRKLGEIACKNGKNVLVGQVANGGWTLGQHSKNLPTLEKIRCRNWDWIVLQEHSLIPAKDEAKRERSMDPAIEILLKEIQKIGASPLLYQTWGRRDGDPDRSGDDFYNMNERVRRGYQAASQKANRIKIVPVGDAWERETRAGRGKQLYIEDGSHPSHYGDTISAKQFYESIFESQATLE